MAEILQNNQMARRTCILYEFLHGNSVKNAHQKFCKTIGNDAIEYKEFEFWFKRFADGKIDLDDEKEQIAHLEDVIRNDKVAIRSCILYEFCEANPVEIPVKETKESEETPAKTTGNSMFANFKPSPLVEIRPIHTVYLSYESLCKVIGYDTMEYREFDYWYYQFAAGNFNLDCEKSFNSNQISLMNMPIEIITKVTGKLNLKERSIFRKVSRNLRNIVDNHAHTYDEINVYLWNKSISINFDLWGLSITYKQDNDDCDLSYPVRRYFSEDIKHKTIKNGNYLEMAINDLGTFIKNPLQLNTFTVTVVPVMSYGEEPLPEQEIKAMESFFKSLNSQIHVKNFMYRSKYIESIFKILPYLKPRALEKIILEIEWVKDESMRKVVELDQWKQAIELKMSETGIAGPIDNLLHFKRFDTYYYDICLEDLTKIRDILLKSTTFKYCRLEFWWYDDVDFNAAKQIFGQHIPSDPNIYHYPVVNSNDEYFEVTLNNDLICCEKKKKKL